MVQFDHKQKFMKIQRKNASLYTNTHFIAKIMFMDIWMIFMKKKFVLSHVGKKVIIQNFRSK